MHSHADSVRVLRQREAVGKFNAVRQRADDLRRNLIIHRQVRERGWRGCECCREGIVRGGRGMLVNFGLEVELEV